tara:strand:+ start:1110 stop:1763 length:654 start_codon:yes stop_codon:yes gene_type:complete
MFFGNLRRMIQRKDVPTGRSDEIAEQVLRQRATDRNLPPRLDRISDSVLGQTRSRPVGGTLIAPVGGTSGMIRQLLPRAGIAGLLVGGGLTAYDMTKDAIANNPDFIKDVGRMVARGRLAFEEGLDQAKQYGAEAVELFMDGYRDGMESKTSSMELTEPSDFGEAMVERKMKDFPPGSKPKRRFGDPLAVSPEPEMMSLEQMLGEQRGSGLGSLRMQ